MNKQRRASGKVDTMYVKKFKDGDGKAFQLIYDYYKNSIYYFALKLLKNSADAEEIVQETFTIVFQKIHTLQSVDSFHSWLFSIAYKSMQTMFRKRAKDQTIMEGFDIELLADLDNDQQEYFEKKEFNNAVYMELTKMSEKFLKVGILRFFEGMSIEEIATYLKIPNGTVKTRLKRIREVIQPQLEQKGFSPIL